MNIREENNSPLSTGCQPSKLLIILLCCVLPAFAVSTQSFWIDEALTATKAASPTLTLWWERMVAEKASDLQMPLYMLITWGAAQLFGTSEWVLRAVNLPWFAAGLIAFAFSFRGRERMFAAIVGGLSPFAWFYLDEARPYAMQLGASLLVTAAIRRLAASAEGEESRNAKWFALFCVGVGVLAGTSLLGVFWCGAATAILMWVVGWGRLRRVFGVSPKWMRTVSLLAVGWLVFLAGYYIWTLKIGARASAMATTNWQSPVFVIYELLGFGGLGPGRLEIRTAGLAAFKSSLFPLLIYAGIISPALILGASGFWRKNRRVFIQIGIVVAGTLLCLFAAGWLTHFRVLGRHCAPALPVALVLLIESANISGKWRRIICILIIAAFASSGVSGRFAERHRKDDYRAAAAFARKEIATGKTVWWSADAQAAEFYGMKTTVEPTNPMAARLVLNPDDALLANLPLPDLVIFSKPDLYDVHGALAGKMATGGMAEVARFSAFKVMQRDGCGETETRVR